MTDRKFLPPLAALRAFEAVGRLGGVRPAAKELMSDHAVISRNIRSLEAWVGNQLFVRDDSGYALTEAGKAYHEQICSAMNSIVGATRALMIGEEELKLRIQCIPGFASLWLSDRLSEFISANRDIDVDFHPSDVAPDFRSKDVDGDIRYIREWEEAALPKIVHRLEFARPEVFPVASPEFASSRKLQGASDFLDLALLHEDNDLEWRHWLIKQGVPVPERLPGTRLWHAHLTLNAARQGQGVALANSLLLRDDIEAGRLVALSPAEGLFLPVCLGGYNFIAREGQWNSLPIARFRRWLRGVASAERDRASH